MFQGVAFCRLGSHFLGRKDDHDQDVVLWRGVQHHWPRL